MFKGFTDCCETLLIKLVGLLGECEPVLEALAHLS
jgi:hypothetical protein